MMAHANTTTPPMVKPHYTLLLNEASAAIADKHVPIYTKKGLLRKYDSLADLSNGLKVPLATLRQTLSDYRKAASKALSEENGEDRFGKRFFENAEHFKDEDRPFFTGTVTPVLHYCMGGLRVDGRGRALAANGSPVPGLFAVGEVSGGIHGKTRLGGNALTECVVFGRAVGTQIPLKSLEPPPALNHISSAAGSAPNSGAAPTLAPAAPAAPAAPVAPVVPAVKVFDLKAVGEHAGRDDCWIILHDDVYDFTDFIDDHPAGAKAILDYCGKDGTDIFEELHNRGMLEDFTPHGTYQK